MQLCRIIYYSLAALHVSSDIYAHHQVHLNCITASDITHLSRCRLVSWECWNLQLHLVGHFRILHHYARKYEYEIYNIYAEFTDGSRYVDTVVFIYIYIYIYIYIFHRHSLCSGCCLTRESRVPYTDTFRSRSHKLSCDTLTPITPILRYALKKYRNLPLRNTSVYGKQHSLERQLSQHK